MFGKEYHHAIDVLFESFRNINKDYNKRVLTGIARHPVFTALQMLYIRAFGIPEVGFQIRSLHVQQMLNTHVSKKPFTRILDAGSGIGAYVFWLAKKYKNAIVTGGDIDADKLTYSELLKKKLNAHNTKFTYLDITKTNTNGRYDLIVTIDVLEHVVHYKKALRTMYRLLRPGGYLYVHVPQPDQKRIFKRLKAWHHEDHVREGVSNTNLQKILKQIGFTIVNSRETFGFFGKLAWEINHLALSQSMMLGGLVFPLLYPLIILDTMIPNANGLGVAMLAQKE